MVRGALARVFGAALRSAEWAPGARRGIALLLEQGIEVVIASITWQFAVEWLARDLGISRVLGTVLEAGRRIQHVWPRDKAPWLRQLALSLDVPEGRLAAVGDSRSDESLLSAASLRFYVGLDSPPALPDTVHRPGGDIEEIAREIVSRWRK